MHPQQKRKEEKGFDMLEAIYAEKGLISGESHVVAKAIADPQAHADRHVIHEKEKRGRAEFVFAVKGAQAAEKTRESFLHSPEGKKKRQEKLPLQMKKPDVEDPKKGKEGKR